MASPFTVFRRNQKMMLALLTILAMFGFVFLPMVMDMLGTRTGGTRNPVVVKTNTFGSLRASDIHDLQQNHLKLLQVLTAVVSQSHEQASPESVRRYLENAVGFGPTTEDNVVNRWLMTKQAEKRGIVISDTLINHFLKGITQNKVSAEQFQTAFRSAGMNVRQFFHLLRGALMANELQAVFQVGIDPRATTPGQRWDYFNRVKRSANIEAIAVPVANFAGQVQTPTDEELTAFFEKHKNQYPIPTSPEPGFRKPATIALQYLKLDGDKLLASVSEDEIRQRYEKDKATYDQLFQKLDKAAEKAEGGKDASAPKEDAKAATEQKATTEQKPAGETVKEPTAKPEAPATEKETPKSSEKNVEPADKKSNSTSSRQRSSVMLVSMTEDNKPTETKAADETQPTNKTAAPTKEAVKESKEPVEEPAKKEDSAAAAKAAEKAPAEKPASPAGQPSVAKEPPTAKTAGGLTDQIKGYIREQIAAEKRSKIFESVQKQVDEYRQQYNDYQAQSLSNKTLPPPQPLNLEQLAKENGLAHGEIPLMPQWELRGTELGASLVNARVPVAEVAYQGLSLFRPAVSVDTQGNVYMLWKSQETKSEVPKFEDVREQALASWKLFHARDQAMKQAEALAKEAITAKKPLAEVFAKKENVQVITPPSFTWMNQGTIAMGWQQQAVLSNVAKIDFAGEEFMRSVFGLDTAGDVTVAFNAPKTVAYVVRLKEFSPHYSLLWEIFQREDFRSYVSAAAADFQQIQEAWLNALKSSAGFVWVGPRQSGEADERAANGEES